MLRSYLYMFKGHFSNSFHMKMVLGRTYYYNGSKSNMTLASRGDKHKVGGTVGVKVHGYYTLFRQ